MSVLDLMTPEQRKRAEEPMAMTLCKQARFPMGDHPQRLTGHFHQNLGIPVNTAPMIPSVTDRLRRGMLLLEEVLETFAAMGLQLTVPFVWAEGGVKDALVLSERNMTLEHIEGSRYDVIETADGLSDINVIVAGTAVEFGIPVHVTDYEVYSSNLTKVREDGTPIINGVTEGYRAAGTLVEHEGQIVHEVTQDEPGYQSNRPIGKILKPDSFVKANIPAALLAFERKEF